MLTFLSSAKSFTGYTDNIQRNAISSWLAVHPDVEVIIYGDGEGVSEACHELGLGHVSDTPCSPSGIPYFNGIVEHARFHARHDIQCYLNCDILLTPHIITAISCIPFSPYLIIGQRIDLAEGVDLYFSQGWMQRLEQLVEKGLAALHATTGIDYFVFPRGLWNGLLPLVIGRAGYDGALLAFCMRHNIPIVDGTLAIPAMHQFHDYRHVAGSKNEVWRGKDAEDNFKIHGIKHSRPLISDACWQIAHNEMVPISSRINLLRRLELKLRFTYGMSICGLTIRALYRVIQLSGFKSDQTKAIEAVLSEYR